MVRRVERALAEWRAAMRRLEGLTPDSADWEQAARDADLARRHYEAIVEGRSIGPGGAAIEDLGGEPLEDRVG